MNSNWLTRHHKQPTRQLNLVLFEDDQRLITYLQTKLGLGKSALLRLAIRKLAEQEGIEL